MRRGWTSPSWVVLALLSGCVSTISVNEQDAGADDAGRGPCESAVDVANFFAEQGCIACHAGAQPPDLRFDALEQLATTTSSSHPGHPLVTPGDPLLSDLYLRLAGPLPADAPTSWWMPLGATGPHPAPGAVENWIKRGAEVWCAGENMPAPPPGTITNPNDYLQDTLFNCTDPNADRSSPARLRRINQREFSLASGSPVGSRWSKQSVTSNPLEAAAGTSSTRSGDLSIDTTTLQLLLISLPSAAQPWVTRGQSGPNDGRYWTVYSGTANVIYSATTPAAADRDTWVDTMLRQGALFRTPTDDERARVRALLDAEIAAENPADTMARATTLRTVTSAARLMAGALFRSELGVGAGSRRRLGNEELALALGRVLGAQPVSSSLWGTAPADAGTDPDWSRALQDGRFAEIRDAVDGGALQDAEALRRLFRRYRGGVDPQRLDLTESERSSDRPAVSRERGEYWLSDGLARFFREWFEVDNAETVFKDTPNATSNWVVPRSNAESTGYDLLRSPYQRETLLPLFDDTVARAVIEAEASGGDVFKALLTTRTYRVASNLVGIDTTRPCTQPSDCGDFRVGSCYVAAGYCTSFGTSELNRVFNLGVDVPDTQAARWVTLPATERAGLLTHPAFLSSHGGNFEDDASLVHRGRWIRENLLCNDVPGLELVTVPAMLGPHAADKSARDRVHEATEGAGSPCATCHSEMNPYGDAFEIYNHAGFLRADDHGRPPNGSTTITNAPTPELNRSYRDAIELSETFANSPYARRCFIRNVFRHFMGRDESPADACTLAAMESSFAGGSFFAMLETLLTSDTFLYRHDVGGTP